MKNQNDLYRMFKVIRAIEHDGLENTQYSTKEISQDEIVDTTLYLGTIQSRLLTYGYYIFIWMDPHQWMEETERGYYPEPNLVLNTYGESPNQDTIVLIYKFSTIEP